MTEPRTYKEVSGADGGRRTRQASIERSSVNADTGEFRAVLVSDGEASDGHILDIAGGVIPERMPLFINHRADPVTQLGSLFFDGKTPHTVRVRGQIMLDGVGAEADIRRDLIAKMAAGHVSRFSVRWDFDAKDAVLRTELPEDHTAHVSDKMIKAKGWWLRFGLFFKRWFAQEGSLVGLGADPQATLRWAEDASAPEAVRSFWRSLHDEETTMRDENGADAEVETSEPANEKVTEETEAAAQIIVAAPAETVTIAVAEPEKAAPSAEARLAALGAYVRELSAAGVDLESMASVIEAERAAPEPTVSDLMTRISSLERKLAAYEEEGRVAGPPSGPLNVAAILRKIAKEADERRASVLADFTAYVDEQRGRVLDDAKKAAASRIRKLIEEHRKADASALAEADSERQQVDSVRESIETLKARSLAAKGAAANHIRQRIAEIRGET